MKLWPQLREPMHNELIVSGANWIIVISATVTTSNDGLLDIELTWPLNNELYSYAVGHEPVILSSFDSCFFIEKYIYV
jgi:hypothetical protein